MPIFDIENRRALFLHIPKAAGSSLTKWLSQHGTVSFFRPRPVAPFSVVPQHLRWRDFDYLLNEPVFDYIFAVVRNPFDRIESEYFWVHRNADARGEPWDDFSSWVERKLNVVKKNACHADNHFCTQVSFLSDTAEVFKIEEGMEKILSRVSEALEVSLPDVTPHLNARRSKRIPPTWSGDAISAVREYYSPDFEAFGYDKKDRSIQV
jgi:hypothetical protein